MITEAQIRDIRNFLASKKLQSDLFLEVSDHFVVQISQLMLSKNIDFEEAFLQTKILWMGELRMVKADILSFKKITVIEKRIVNKRLNKVLLNSILFLPIILGINFIFPDLGVFFVIFLSAILLFLFGLSLIKKKLKFRDYLFIGFHPLILKIILIGYILPFLIFSMLPANFTVPELILGLSKNISLAAFAVVTQIQLLYSNFNNKKVLLS
ncbi:hypothetical protein [Frigoriflavimonas asaccharolytica]|uniref:Uncharacterized protein n=1 Tax=Frigoriflavimonas asaccharolytica TaxID=2735899 RepID=A0A8J8G956_9FLAO|nr:hypothetical protein [Frigoriflavimonas asaccharolytica]NRS93611.1 hypothetical protein [Frigoriflavimonas asaccharolytica]